MKLKEMEKYYSGEELTLEEKIKLVAVFPHWIGHDNQFDVVLEPENFKKALEGAIAYESKSIIQIMLEYNELITQENLNTIVDGFELKKIDEWRFEKAANVSEDVADILVTLKLITMDEDEENK